MLVMLFGKKYLGVRGIFIGIYVPASCEDGKDHGSEGEDFSSNRSGEDVSSISHVMHCTYKQNSSAQ